MKPYLNSSQKTQTSFMAAMLAMMTEFDQNNTLSKTEKTAMKYTTTHLTKLLKSIFGRMPDVENRVKHDLKDNRVVLSPKFNKLNEREYVDLSDLCDLLEMLSVNTVSAVSGAISWNALCSRCTSGCRLMLLVGSRMGCVLIAMLMRSW